MPDTPPSLFQRLQARLHHLFVGGDEVGREHQPTRLQQFFHFWRLAVQSFLKNRLPVRAASLSYTTILALVPFLAVAMGITSSLLKDQSEDRIARFVDRFVESIVPPAVLTNRAPEAATADGPRGGEPPGTTADADRRAGESVEGVSTQRVAAAFGAGGSLTNAPAFKPRVLDESVQDQVARSIQEFIQNTRSGTLGMVGTVALVFLAISMLTRIEDAFNDVWGVRKGRSWFMRLVLYWTVISLAPVMLAVALGLATGPHLAATQRLIGEIPLLGWLVFQFLPVIVLCLAFATFYMLMPNTKVRWNAALIGAIVAALLWHINNSLSALYVSRVVTNFKIYGSLGLVPVFMIGLYFAWVILLFGGQISYAWQNRLAYFQERVTDNVNQRGKEFVALRLMTAISAAYQRGFDPPSESQMSEALEIPPRLTQQVLRTLVAARLITEVSGGEPAYVPARPTESISCHDVLQALRAGQGTDMTFHEGPLHRQILGEFQRINDAERRAAESVSIRALADRANALLVGGVSEPEQLTSGKAERT
jgi:membrane protein